MCGIAGYFGNKKISLSNIRSTLSLMINRGPDSKNFKTFLSDNINVTLLHSRLSIIDLNKRSNQPFVYNDKILVFNGEIYNYLELKDHLIGKNYIFKTNSDTEVLIKLYDCYGENMFPYLEGMWAFAIFDKKTKKIILSRDRFGEKPLQILKKNHGIFFGSETKFIESLSSQYEQPNDIKAKHFLSFGYNSLFLNDQTFKKNVKSLKPSNYMKIDSNLNISVKEYWKLGENIKEIYIKEKDASKNISELLTNSLKIRLRSDVKNIFCLSGGIDSGSLVSIASKKFNMQVDTFSIIDNNSLKYNEKNLIEHTLKDTNANYNFLYTNKINFFENLKNIIIYYESPVLTVNYLLHALMQKQISEKGYKVVLSGNGADEIFAGYYDHYLYHLSDLKSYHSKKEFQNSYQEWKKYLYKIIRNKDYKYFNKYYKNRNINLSIKNRYNNIIKSSNSLKLKNEKIFKSDLKNKMIFQIPERLYPVLYMDDLNSMMSSIENRTPFLDRKLIEFLFSLPSNLFIKKAYSKFLLRKSMQGILNDKIRNSRRKYGFNASLSSFNDFSKKNYTEYLYDSINHIDHLVNKENLYKYIKNIDFDNMTDEENKFLFRLISTSIFYSNRI